MSKKFLKAADGRFFRLPSDDEDAAINAAAALDPDSPVLTDDEWSKVLPRVRVGLPPNDRPLKSPVTMRLDGDLLAYLKSTGKGWQTRVNAILRDWVKNNDLGSKLR
jgi:uncharacterized protein (DUF4415 family)